MTPAGAGRRGGRFRRRLAPAGVQPSVATRPAGIHAPSGRRRERGQATVELALLLPVVAVVALLVVQVALVVRAQILTIQAAREGARVAAVDRRASAVSDAAVTPGLDPGALHVTTERVQAQRRVRVVVTYRVKTDVALIGPALPDLTVRAEATMRSEEPDPPGQ